MCKLAFLGDVYLKNNCNYIDIPEPFIFNYECVAADKSTPPMINKINLSGTQNFNGFTHLPIAVNLANNHILDYMDEGFKNTIDLLEQNKIKFFGAGTKEDNYHNPCILNIDGKRIAMIGYSDVYHSLEQANTTFQVARPIEQQIKHDIALCQQQNAEIIIVNVHWGREERFWHTERQRNLGKMFIDLGASLVIGHHPHCIQPVELYKGHHIFYSLGNGYFPDISTPSYYDNYGNSDFIMHKKHLPYGRKSLKVIFDIERGKVSSTRLLKLKADKLTDTGEVAYDKVVPKIYSYPLINNFTGYWHMLALFLRSYFLVDGKLFSIKAVKKEFEFIRKRKK